MKTITLNLYAPTTLPVGRERVLKLDRWDRHAEIWPPGLMPHFPEDYLWWTDPPHEDGKYPPPPGDPIGTLDLDLHYPADADGQPPTSHAYIAQKRTELGPVMDDGWSIKTWGCVWWAHPPRNPNQNERKLTGQEHGERDEVYRYLYFERQIAAGKGNPINGYLKSAREIWAKRQAEGKPGVPWLREEHRVRTDR